ncbi:MAG: hypothetical protein A2V90_01310 [Gammaproteobacteria bacterium RBG_16_57_12]|nr:MAG: hypothetical protein A2V90_01310 [Gammaproteobacteria bacterium RBG_16_57_12]
MNNTRRNIIGFALITLIMLFNTGCSALSNSALINELRFGKLIAANNALRDAATNCADQDARLRASIWAKTAINDIRAQGTYFKKESPEYIQAVGLINNLALVNRSTATPEQSCKQLRKTYKMTNEYIALLSNTPVLIAQN